MIAMASASLGERRPRALEPIRHRAEVERDQHAEHEQHKNLRDGLEQPEQEDVRTVAVRIGAN